MHYIKIISTSRCDQMVQQTKKKIYKKVSNIEAILFIISLRDSVFENFCRGQL